MCLAISVFVCVVLLSQVVLVQANDNMKAPVQESSDGGRAAAQKLYNEGLKLYSQGTVKSLRSSIEKFFEALKLYQQIGDKKSQAIILSYIGKVYNSLGDKQQALKFYNQSLPLSIDVGDKAGQATTLTNIGFVYNSLGDKQQALKFYNQSLPLMIEVGNKEGQAATLNNIGFVYNHIGDKQQALKFFNQSLPLMIEVGNKAGQATTLNNIGNVYSSLGDKQQALKFYYQSLPLIIEVGDKAGQATTLNNIGLVYSSLGDKQQALKFYYQSLPLTIEVGDKAGQAITLNNIGLVYSSLGDKQQALKFLNQSLPLTIEIRDKAQQATTLSNIGLVYDDLGDKQQALKFYNQSLPLRIEVGDKAGQAITLNNIGNVCSDLGDKQQALKFYNQSLPLSIEVGDKAQQATTLSNIGSVYDDLGDKQQALKFYNQSLPLRIEVGDKAGQATILGNMADLERNRGYLEESLKQIQAAIQIIESLRQTYTNKDLQSTYFSTVQDYYQFYIDLLIELDKKYPNKGYDTIAFNISERSRARSLVDLLTEANASIRKGVNPKLLASEQLILGKIEALQKQMQQPSIPNDEARLEKLKQENENLLNQYRELVDKIRTTSPKYGAIKYPEPLELKQIQQQLDKDTLLLQYFLGKNHSYLWAVTPDSLYTYELPKSSEIEFAAQDFSNTIADTLSVNEPAKARKLIKLSQMILAPALDKLGKKRLAIVADGPLQTIPFAALADPTNKIYQPLMVNHEIVNLPSVTAIATQRQRFNNEYVAPKTLAVLADPVFEASDKRLTGKEPTYKVPEFNLNRSSLQRALKNLKRNGWERLDGTRTEAEQILKLVPSQDAIHAYDFDANYNFVTNPELKQYRFLLFATHGFVDTTNPELSGIVLSQFDKQGKPVEKGYLRLGDIFNLDLGAELVVLSACETGLGKDIKGEGLVGLTRGLMYAGSKRAVVSLWQVNDEGTSKLMLTFYKAVLTGKLPTVALREAQLQFWQGQDKERQRPYYWAPFTLQGDWK
ncbi:hypothetical protein NIES2101_43485 [Calothrix sp. HK-06]|nr:hypothetical protein NIES2101_43485 [Calothrix sp. HK-06]